MVNTDWGMLSFFCLLNATGPAGETTTAKQERENNSLSDKLSSLRYYLWTSSSLTLRFKCKKKTLKLKCQTQYAYTNTECCCVILFASYSTRKRKEKSSEVVPLFWEHLFICSVFQCRHNSSYYYLTLLCLGCVVKNSLMWHCSKRRPICYSLTMNVAVLFRSQRSSMTVC